MKTRSSVTPQAQGFVADPDVVLEQPPGEQYPPAPHDPRERELALSVGDWEVRLFGGRKLDYFVTRGFWHAQLWHPDARISILTPSRLTLGLYEAFRVASARWKVQAPDYAKLVTLLEGVYGVALPPELAVLRVERALVHDVVRASGNPFGAS